MNYEDSIKHLQEKYGIPKDSYFSEKSYYRYMNGDIKSITKNKITRTSDGLYCHHIDEDKYMRISLHDWCKRQNVPFESHEKEKIVYCDLIEHCILHVLIAASQENAIFGIQGYLIFLKPNVLEWFVENKEPALIWEKNCKDVIQLTNDEATLIIKEMDYKLN